MCHQAEWMCCQAGGRSGHGLTPLYAAACTPTCCRPWACTCPQSEPDHNRRRHATVRCRCGPCFMLTATASAWKRCGRVQTCAALVPLWRPVCLAVLHGRMTTDRSQPVLPEPCIAPSTDRLAGGRAVPPAERCGGRYAAGHWAGDTEPQAGKGCMLLLLHLLLPTSRRWCAGASGPGHCSARCAVAWQPAPLNTHSLLETLRPALHAPAACTGSSFIKPPRPCPLHTCRRKPTSRGVGPPLAASPPP